MEMFIKSIDQEAWKVIENGPCAASNKGRDDIHEKELAQATNLCIGSIALQRGLNIIRYQCGKQR